MHSRPGLNLDSRDKDAGRLVLEAGGGRRHWRGDACGTGEAQFACIPPTQISVANNSQPSLYNLVHLTHVEVVNAFGLPLWRFPIYPALPVLNRSKLFVP